MPRSPSNIFPKESRKRNKYNHILEKVTEIAPPSTLRASPTFSPEFVSFAFPVILKPNRTFEMAQRRKAAVAGDNRRYRALRPRDAAPVGQILQLKQSVIDHWLCFAKLERLPRKR